MQKTNVVHLHQDQIYRMFISIKYLLRYFVMIVVAFTFRHFLQIAD
jgi:hypothetical protein